MFKCCMCNSTPKKANEETKLKANEETKLKTDDMSIGSPKLTAVSEKVDDDNQSLTKANKLNGNVQRVEKTPSVASDSTPVRANSIIKNSCEIPQNGNADVEENLDDNSMEKAPDNSIADDPTKVRTNSDENSINFSGLDKNEEGDNVNSGVISVTKTNLSDTSGYVEKITDEPEDEGDDSVFEACLSENETVKAPPAASIPSLQLEEDDGEYASEGCSGMQEPPATPVARDELALRRHRFFSDLLQAAQNSTEHKVRFDPLGPMVHSGGENSDREEHLEELVNRLENVTKRLENISVHSAIQTQDIAIQTSSPILKEPTSAASTLSEEDISISSTIHLNEQAVPNQPTNMSIAGYENLLSGSVREYVEISQKIGSDVAEHSKLVEKLFQMQFEFIQMAQKRPQPTTQPEYIKLLGPMSVVISKIQHFREEKRCLTNFFNHLSAVSESIPALGWVAMSPAPAPFVKEMNDAGQFYTNRVLKDWKEKDKIHVDWCKAWVQTLTDLQQYIRQYHTTGLVWGKPGAAPTNVPPPPPPSMPAADVAPLAVNDDRSALFAQINQGEDITKNLKKVTSDMQTHKNPGLRSGPAPFKAPATNTAALKSVPPANVPIDKPSVFTRDGKKWLVEYHKGENLTIDSAEMNNVVYMFRCQDSTLTIKGKINSVVMDSCRKSSVVFDSLVSSIEFVNCQSVQMQVLGKVPTISIDKTDGCQMYLSTESLNVELITSKSSEMNVMVPKANGDYSEYPVPEQFKTTISKNGSLHTMAVDSLG
ncbi:adenylyl cyclase-associated protein 1 isoform X1 [Linepithema humile]|uniref:adenylyl cyclase-associated protein 1 isoform X1 n=2 Tax=Linepithema humile TaxID=83485 RepID=UPI00351F568B